MYFIHKVVPSLFRDSPLHHPDFIALVQVLIIWEVRGVVVPVIGTGVR